MVRLRVPDDHSAGYITVAGRKDRNPEADVQTDAVDHARDVSVREDDDGRYVGVSGHYAAAVAEYLGVDVPTPDDADDAEGEDAEDGDVTETDSAEEETPGEDSDAEPETVTDAIEDGVCPWCDDYTGDGVPQHAGSAHPEKWQAYKEASE